jgi:hypothetical protein
MRSKSLAILFFLLSFPVFAQEPGKVLTFTVTKPCAPIKDIVDNLTNKWKESPIFFMLEPVLIEGNNQSVVQEVRTVMWLNTKNKTYTIVQIPPHLPANTYLCIVGSGKISHVEKSVLLELIDNGYAKAGR